jgi:hypothetical protein
MPIAIFLKTIISRRRRQAIQPVQLPSYMIPTKEHKALLQRLTGNNPGKVKEVYKGATNELIIKQGPYMVSAEIENEIVGCYCCYRHDKLLETIYPEEVRGLHWFKERI